MRRTVVTRCLAFSLVAIALVTQSRGARADDAGSGPNPMPMKVTDKSQYSLFNPTPDSDLRAFASDRPPKINTPFTVDAGRFQIESDLANYAETRDHGLTTKTFQALDPVLKLGVLNNVDLEVALNGYQDVRQSMAGMAGPAMHFTGFGDVFFRTKINLIGNDGGDFVFAVVPYVKIPSSSPASLALGNGVVEGGGYAILQTSLPQDFKLVFQTEGDALKGGADSQRHANFVNIAQLNHAVPGIKDLTAAAEIFTSISTDRFTADKYTADFALAYMVDPVTQLDVGIDTGLNRAAPAFQVFSGISHRF